MDQYLLRVLVTLAASYFARVRWFAWVLEDYVIPRVFSREVTATGW